MAESDFQDLIIVKRRLNTEPEMPKGGVWKIAFADFMTAMMCFFLVMWLINASNEDTRKAVASYFNPIRLAELNRKGLNNPQSPSENQTRDGQRTLEESIPGSAAPAAPPTPSADLARDALFKDPYRVLSEIAAQSVPVASVGASGAGGDVSAAAVGPLRDPFDPDVFMEEPAAAPRSSGETATAGEAPYVAPLRLSLPSVETGSAAASGDVRMSSTADDGGAAMPVLPAVDPMEPTDEESRSALQAELSEAVKAETGSNESPTIAVEQTGEGVMISLTDDVDFGMFSVGSAEPQPQMVRIMERIAAILKARSGSIAIRGHTDARPFRTAGYDNWRLSTDRAQIAYYMLVRGGLDERRVVAIEGYADRRLKKPGDPEAAENRRIEILLGEAS